MALNFVLAWRGFKRTPGLSLVAVACLAVAIGIATAAFVVVNGAVLRPLPVPHGDRLVTVREIHVARGYNLPHTPEQFLTARDRSRAFDALGAWYTRNVTFGTAADPRGLVRAAYVSADALDIV